MTHNFKWVKILFICLIWDLTGDTAVANANGVLVKLICDGSGSGYIRLCLVLL